MNQETSNQTASAPAVASSVWLDGNTALKDGTSIVAIGRVIWCDEYSTAVDGFVAAIRWIKDQSGYEGWHFDRDGMTVARTLDDEVMVDWWLPMPSNARSEPHSENL
jgi:hypothetical protein